MQKAAARESRIEVPFRVSVSASLARSSRPRTTLDIIRVFQFDGFTFQASNHVRPRQMLKKLKRSDFRRPLNRPDGACVEWPVSANSRIEPNLAAAFTVEPHRRVLQHVSEADWYRYRLGCTPASFGR